LERGADVDARTLGGTTSHRDFKACNAWMICDIALFL